MNWRLRKIFKIGPVRTTLSKRGVGLSWGIPGFRIGVSANGRKYITIGIPGTGFYFFKYFNPSIKNPEPPNINKIEQKDFKNQNEIPWWKQKNL